MRMKRIGVLVGSAAVLALSTVAGAGAVGQNLSFEESPFFANWFRWIPNGSSQVQGWVVGGNSVDVIHDGYWEASDGELSIDLNGNGAGSLSQTFTTVVGQPYRVTFDLSANPDDGSPTLHSLHVSATGVPSASYEYDRNAAGNTREQMKWTTKSYVFVATTDSTTLTFQSTTGTDSHGHFWGPALDNVRIDEVGTEVCKKGGWQALADSDGRKFKNQGDCVSYIATGGKNKAAGD